MSFYEAFRDAMNMAQKADNIELYRQLLDLGAQALDLQAEVAKLREEIAELKKSNDLEADIEYYVDPFITKRTDLKAIKYCAACWVDKQKLVPLQDMRWDNYKCPLCGADVIDMRDFEHRNQ